MKKLVDLVDDGNILIPKVFGGIDTNNVIATKSGNWTWTATEDCVLVGIYDGNNAGFSIYIDNVMVLRAYGASHMLTYIQTPIKKGQVVSGQIINTSGYSCKIYGVKYN